MSRQMRIYTVCHHIIAGLTSVVIIFIMILTLVEFNNSKDVEGAWPKEPLLTPTNVMLAVSVVSLFADAISLGFQCFGGHVAVTAKTYAGYVKNVMKGIQLVVTAAGSGIFKSANVSSGKKDLWGWSCSDAADAMSTVNNSGTLCSTNVSDL
jgi:hypothetical protein